jgi:hypothetical protein
MHACYPPCEVCRDREERKKLAQAEPVKWVPQRGGTVLVEATVNSIDDGEAVIRVGLSLFRFPISQLRPLPVTQGEANHG